MTNPFVLNRLRKEPISYWVGIDHLVVGGEWTMRLSVNEINESPEDKRRVASDLRRAADMLEEAAGEESKA